MPSITNAERNGQSVCVPRQCGGTPVDGDGTVTGNVVKATENRCG